MVERVIVNWPPVWLLFATYRRTDVSLQAIASIKKYLSYPNLHWHICDDNSGDTDDGTNRHHVSVLMGAIGGDVTSHEMDTLPGEFNLGGSTNRGIRTAQEHGCDIYLIVCDDDALIEPWDIRPHVDLLDSQEEVGAIRCAHLSEGMGVMVDSYMTDRIGLWYSWGRIVRSWSLNNPWKSQCYLNIYDTILYHSRFLDAYGWFPENLHPGQTEVDFCAQYTHSELVEKGPAVFIPLGKGPGSPWRHLAGHAHYYKKLVDGEL